MDVKIIAVASIGNGVVRSTTISNYKQLEDFLKIDLQANKMLMTLLASLNIFVDGALNFTIPEGYVTDGMSIPKWLQPIIGEPFEGNTIRAALIHDYLCSTKIRSQAFTHGIFGEMLKADGVSFWRRKAAYLAVVSYNRLKNPKWK